MSKFKVPATFTVPDTIEGVVGLLTARGWEKAAIVYAWTKPDKPGPKSPKDRTEIRTIYGIREFAALGITGLRTAEDVSWYRQQWIKAIEDGWADIVGPGDVVDVPDMDFPITNSRYSPQEHPEYAEAAQDAGVSLAMAKRAGSNTAALKAAIKADPKVAEAAWEAIQEASIERANDAALEAIQRGGKVTITDRRPKAKDMWPEVMDEVGRAEPIHDLRQKVEEIHVLADQIIANGDPQGREAEFLQPVVEELGEIYWTLSKLVVEVKK